MGGDRRASGDGWIGDVCSELLAMSCSRGTVSAGSRRVPEMQQAAHHITAQIWLQPALDMMVAQQHAVCCGVLVHELTTA